MLVQIWIKKKKKKVGSNIFRNTYLILIENVIKLLNKSLKYKLLFYVNIYIIYDIITIFENIKIVQNKKNEYKRANIKKI